MMGKRSNYPRIDKDAYMTWDPRAALPLINALGGIMPYKFGDITYYEPCVGNGDLIKLLPYKCVGYSDIEKDARTTQYTTTADCFITNPPWSRKLLHPIIENLRKQLPTWLLFDADWMHTQQAIPYMKYCKAIISIGRVRWIPESKHDGVDNCVWYLFTDKESDCTFISRKYR